eukprot:GHVU01048532.1.p1 GENE.GHVU01048532.1~~GHVU01048532.1.p1  ORF type:complete len:136 (-),score=1.51 GHVU01048532.1:581-988(-)
MAENGEPSVAERSLTVVRLASSVGNEATKTHDSPPSTRDFPSQTVESLDLHLMSVRIYVYVLAYVRVYVCVHYFALSRVSCHEVILRKVHNFATVVGRVTKKRQDHRNRRPTVHVSAHIPSKKAVVRMIEKKKSK